MKTTISLFLLIISISTFADGGNGYGMRCHVHDLEPKLNLFYISLDGTVTYLNNKEKIKTRDVTSNIVIYDITNKTSKHLHS